MNDQDRDYSQSPANHGTGDQDGIREPQIRRPDLDSEENVEAEREAFFRDFNQNAAEQTGQPDPQASMNYPRTNYPSDSASSADQNYQAYEDSRAYQDYDGYETYDAYQQAPQVPPYDEDNYPADGYGAYPEDQQAYYQPTQASPEQGAPAPYQDYSGEYGEAGQEQTPPWKRIKAQTPAPKEPNPMVEKIKEESLEALKGFVLWIKQFFSRDPRHAMSQALQGQEKLSFIPVFLLLIFIVPLKSLLAFQYSAAGVNAQISAMQGVAPAVRGGTVYGYAVLSYIVEFAIMIGLYYGLMKFLGAERDFTSVLDAVAVSYFPVIFMMPLFIIFTYISLTVNAALFTFCTVFQYFLLAHGVEATLKTEKQGQEMSKISWFWLMLGFVMVSLLLRKLVWSLLTPTISLY